MSAGVVVEWIAASRLERRSLADGCREFDSLTEHIGLKARLEHRDLVGRGSVRFINPLKH